MLFLEKNTCDCIFKLKNDLINQDNLNYNPLLYPVL